VTNRHGDETEPTVLTDFQVEVARLFFSQPHPNASCLPAELRSWPST
jgi:hypothetical protein